MRFGNNQIDDRCVQSRRPKQQLCCASSLVRSRIGDIYNADRHTRSYVVQYGIAGRQFCSGQRRTLLIMSLRERSGNWHYRFMVGGRTWTDDTSLAAVKRNRKAAEAIESEA